MSKEEYIEIKDLDSIKKALENAEIDFEQVDHGEYINIETENGIVFEFNKEGTLEGMYSAN